MRLLGVVISLMVVATSPTLGAQDPVVVSVNDGRAFTPIAQLTAGRWTDACDIVRGRSTSRSTFTVRRGELATTGVRLALLRSVDRDTDEWMRVAPTIARVFRERERGERLSPTATTVSMTIDWVYASPFGAGSNVYYFEASKRIPDAGGAPEEDPTGTLRIAVAGWLRAIGDRVSSIGAKSELRWQQDDRAAAAEVPDLEPLGVVRDNGRMFWVARAQHGSRRRFTIYEMLESRVTTVLVADPQSC